MVVIVVEEGVVSTAEVDIEVGVDWSQQEEFEFLLNCCY